MMRLRIVWLFSILALITAALPAQETKAWSLEGYDASKGEFYVEGKEARLRWLGPATAKLSAVYRPESEVPESEALTPDAEGRVSWKPKTAGLVQLLATLDDKSTVKALVSVRFASTFSIGLVVMVLAALILFGGAFFSIRALLRAGHRLQA